MRRALWAPLLALAACGDAAPSRPPATTRTLTLEATPAGPDDVIVARVDGRPVWGSCVAAQAAGRALTRDAALDECVALEVAAQEAERRGLAASPDVLEEADRVMAAALVDREVTDKVTSVADLPASLVEGVWKKNAWRAHRLEYRGSFFARIEVSQAEGTPADLAAGAAARAAYATLEGRRDLFPADVEAAMRATAGPGMKVTAAGLEPATHGEGSRLQAYYNEPLFALDAIGEVTPPVRGPYGWDLILYTRRIDPLERSRDEVLAELFPALRVRWFLQWAHSLGERHQVRPLADDATVRAALGGEEPAP
jgi:hypothetical protein